MKASIFIRYFCGSVAVLLLWQLGSVTLGSDILPDPLRALGGFWDALKDPEFIGHIGLSLYRLRSHSPLRFPFRSASFWDTAKPLIGWAHR